jgi:hypothetical protein
MSDPRPLGKLLTTNEQALAKATLNLVGDGDPDTSANGYLLSNELTEQRARVAELEAERKAIFIAGWNRGYLDGGEGDCRMFEPSAESAWQLHTGRYVPPAEPKETT